MICGGFSSSCLLFWLPMDVYEFILFSNFLRVMTNSAGPVLTFIQITKKLHKKTKLYKL